MRIKDQVLEVLINATTWLSTNDVVAAVNESYNSTRRALRSLYNEGGFEKKKLAGDRYGRMQWITDANFRAKPPFADASSPTGTVYTKGSKTKKQKAKKGTIQVINTPNHGDLIMQIEQGVETVVGDFVAAGKTFSAHDVTKELRDRVNAGTIQVDPGAAGTAQVAGKTVTKIEHNFVKDAVHQLMTSGKHDYDRNHNGTFFEYAPPSATPAPTGGSTPAPVSGNSYDGGSTL